MLHSDIIVRETFQDPSSKNNRKQWLSYWTFFNSDFKFNYSILNLKVLIHCCDTLCDIDMIPIRIRYFMTGPMWWQDNYMGIVLLYNAVVINKIWFYYYYLLQCYNILNLLYRRRLKIIIITINIYLIQYYIYIYLTFTNCLLHHSQSTQTATDWT